MALRCLRAGGLLGNVGAGLLEASAGCMGACRHAGVLAVCVSRPCQCAASVFTASQTSVVEERGTSDLAAHVTADFGALG